MNALFKALHDPTRRRILEMLRDDDHTAGEIAEDFTISKPSISYHLDLLRQAELVASRKDGRFVRYSLNTTVLEDALQWMMELTDHEPSDEGADRSEP